MGIPVKLQVFEGPLDLLLHLIDKIRLIFMISPSWKLQDSTWSISVRWNGQI